jgi:stage V sporulation protein B
MQAKALPTILFPYAFLTPFCSLIVPEIAEKRAAGDTVGINRISETVCRFVLAFGIGGAGIVACYCGEIGNIIYSDQGAGIYIGMLAPVMPIMFIDTAVDSILKGMNEQLYTMKVNLFDSLMSVGIVFLLVPRIGMLGYIIEIILCEIVNTALSISRLIKLTSPRIRIVKWIALPIVSVSASVFTSRAILTFFGMPRALGALSLTLHITLGVFVYSILLRLLGCYTFREIADFLGKRKYIQKKT